MAAAERVRSVEGCFFHLLASLQAAVDETRLKTTGGRVVGRQAIRRIVDHLVSDFAEQRKRPRAGRELSPQDRRADIDEWYDRFHAGGYRKAGRPAVQFGDAIARLCRLTYQILRFLDESDIEPKQKAFYARILRTQLSGPELVLLFYNCLSRHGYPERHELADRYNMFKNMDPRPLVSPYDVLLYKSLERLAPAPPDVHA